MKLFLVMVEYPDTISDVAVCAKDSNDAKRKAENRPGRPGKARKVESVSDKLSQEELLEKFGVVVIR